MNLKHYSPEPITHIRPIARPQVPGMKPDGFWLSVEDDPDEGWAVWCNSNDFGSLHHTYTVTLDPKANILNIFNSTDLRIFTKEYGNNDTHWNSAIHWPRVVEEYQGIVIAPYQWSCRLDDDTFWYYGWDCASACIWDTSILTLEKTDG